MMARTGGTKKAGVTLPTAEASRPSVQVSAKAGRKPTGAPEQVLRDAATVRLLAKTLKRAKPPFAQSLRSQTTHLVRLALKQRRFGRDTFSEPMAGFAKAAGCKKRQAQENMRDLENWGAFIRLAEGGGAVNATWRLDAEVLHRVLVTRGCNPHPDLRAALRSPETLRGPVQSTHAVTHAVAQAATHAVNRSFSKQNQCFAGNENLSITADGITHAVEGGFIDAIHIVKPNENAFSRICESLAHAELSFCLDAAGGGDVQPRHEPRHEPIVDERKNRPEPSTFTEKPSLAQAECFREEKKGTQSAVRKELRPTCMTATVFVVLRQLRANGPATYGAVASDLRISIGDAWRANAALSKFGVIKHDIIGQMVPFQK
jgi:hypothetical protein